MNGALPTTRHGMPGWSVTSGSMPAGAAHEHQDRPVQVIYKADVSRHLDEWSDL